MLCTVCEKSEVAARAENPHFPFCSQRCKQVDLGRWLVGDYVIPSPSPGLGDGFAALRDLEYQEDDR